MINEQPIGLLPTEICLFSLPSASSCPKFVTLKLWIVHISFTPKQAHGFGNISLTKHSKWEKKKKSYFHPFGSDLMLETKLKEKEKKKSR